MKMINNIREFFWPLLEKHPIAQPDLIRKEDITVDNSLLEKTLGYAIENYKEETERKKTVEGKSSLFIGTISVVTSVIIGVTSVLIKTSNFNLAVSSLVFLLFILTVYMSRTVWFSIQALERRSYFTISINDFLINDTNGDYYKRLIAEITNKIRKNSLTINSKVDSMTMAQEYFKRAIIVVAIYSFVILLYFMSKSGVDYSNFFDNIVTTINTVTLSGWNTLILYILVGLSLVLSIYSIRKERE
jgi:hypothetical protein